MVDVGARTTAGSSNGVVCNKLISAAFFYLKLVWFVFHIHKNGFLVQLF